ncbi:MAG: RNA polymerase sigma factor [Planctomycetota bacterium]|jgi:RNA polymerase sigma factor (sigma-70 family)
MVALARVTDDAVRAAAGGSRRDLGRVVQALLPHIRLMISARLGPTPAQHDAAEDVAQQVVLALTTGIPRLRHRTVAGLQAYLSGIVRRKVAETIRRRARRPGNGHDDGVGRLAELVADGAVSPPGATERAELATRVLAELDRLSPRHREIIVLRFFDQLSTREMAARLHLKRPAASMRLLRAIRALRRRVTETQARPSTRGPGTTGPSAARRPRA